MGSVAAGDSRVSTTGSSREDTINAATRMGQEPRKQEGLDGGQDRPPLCCPQAAAGTLSPKGSFQLEDVQRNLKYYPPGSSTPAHTQKDEMQGVEEQPAES